MPAHQLNGQPQVHVVSSCAQLAACLRLPLRAPNKMTFFFFNPPGPEGFWGVGVSGTPVDESTGVLSRASPPFFGRRSAPRKGNCAVPMPALGHATGGADTQHTHTHNAQGRGRQQRCCVKGWGCAKKPQNAQADTPAPHRRPRSREDQRRRPRPGPRGPGARARRPPISPVDQF